MVKNSALKYMAELKGVMDTISLDKLERILNVMLDAYEAERSIFIMGNGGSGSTASHFACDINKGVTSAVKKRFRVICLNDNIPTLLAYANDSSYDEIFIEQLKNFLEPEDVVIGISGSGCSKNVIRAIQYANEKGAISVAFTGFDGGKLARIAKTSIAVGSSDMQKVEDVHLILTHMIMQILQKELRG